VTAGSNVSGRSERSARFYSRGARLLTVAVTVICCWGETSFLVNHQYSLAARLAPSFAFIIVACWVFFWTPVLVVEDRGVRVVNAFRSYNIGWRDIKSVQTGWVLTLMTTNGVVRASAVQRQSRAGSAVSLRRDSFGLPDFQAEKAFEAEDAASQPSSAAELAIARGMAHFDDARSASPLGKGTDSHFRVARLAVLAALLVLASLFAVSPSWL